MNIFATTLLVRIHPEELRVKDLGSGRVLAERPLIAMSGGLEIDGTNPKILAFGTAAQEISDRVGVRVVNPFVHPRTPLSDFTVAEAVLKNFVTRVRGPRLLQSISSMVLHLAVDLKGGITQIEARALVELGTAVGARKSVGWVGCELSEEEVRRQRFPENGRVIDSNA